MLKEKDQMLKEIKTLEESHTTLSKQAEDLTKALRSGGKSQGMWGELQLERVLDASGLTKGIEYEHVGSAGWHQAFFRTDHHWKPDTALWAAGRIVEKLANDYGVDVNREHFSLNDYYDDKYEKSFLGSQGKNQTLFKIVLPQAVKAVLPTYTSEFIVLIKETSVASFIAVMDLTKAGDMIRNATYNAWIPLLTCAVIYLVMTVGLTKIFGLLEKRLAKSDR